MKQEDTCRPKANIGCGWRVYYITNHTEYVTCVCPISIFLIRTTTQHHLHSIITQSELEILAILITWCVFELWRYMYHIICSEKPRTRMHGLSVWVCLLCCFFTPATVGIDSLTAGRFTVNCGNRDTLTAKCNGKLVYVYKYTGGTACVMVHVLNFRYYI